MVCKNCGKGLSQEGSSYCKECGFKKFVVKPAIEAQQKIQMSNPPSSAAWQAASKEIHRLATILNDGVEPKEARVVVDISGCL